MTIYKKSDLLYTYSWTAIGKDDPKITGKPDSTLFNRHEGYEVLYLINEFMNEKNLISVSSGNKIERMIHNELPSNVRSQENVIKWLKDNW